MRTRFLPRMALLAVTLAAATPALAPTGAAAAPGDLDPSFGTGGRATIHIQPGDLEFGFGGALAPDGKVLITGDVYTTGRASGLVRLTPGGLPDPGFGGGVGFVTTDPTPVENDYSENVLVQPDDRIVVGGSFDGAAGILRYRTDGLPDTGFDGDGTVKTSFGHPQRAGGVLLRPDGRLLWFGRGDYPSGAHSLEVARYEADGSLDMSFGSGGLVSHSLRPGTALEQYKTGLLQPDGKILIGGDIQNGASSYDWAVARLNADGSFDNSFDGDGHLATDFSGADALDALALQPDGRIVGVGVAGGGGPADIALARYLPDGSLDPSFGAGGRQVIDLGGVESGKAIVLQPDGKIVVAGYTDATGVDKDMVVSRLLPRGALDPSFAVAGTKLVGFGLGDDEAHDLLLQPDGRLVVVGWADVPGAIDFAAARLEGAPSASSPPPPPSSGPAPAVIADSAVGLRILGKRLKVNRRGIARLRLRCPADEASPPCRGQVVLRTRAKWALGRGRKAKKRRVVLAKTGFEVAMGRTKPVKLRLGKTKRHLLRTNRRARKVLAIAHVLDGAGNRKTVRKKLRAIPRKAR